MLARLLEIIVILLVIRAVWRALGGMAAISAGVRRTTASGEPRPVKLVRDPTAVTPGGPEPFLTAGFDPVGTVCVAAYIEFAQQRADFRMRHVTPAGVKSAPVTISNVAGNRSSGYPRVAAHGGELVFAWVDRTSGSQVRTALARVPN